MEAELRWILLALSLVLLGGIWWWGARRSRHAPGNAALRESTSSVSAAPGRAGESSSSADPSQSRVYDATSQDWGIPPLEPLSVHTAEFEEHVPALDLDSPMTAHPDPLEQTLDLTAEEREEAASKFAAAPAEAAPAEVPESLEPAITATPPPAIEAYESWEAAVAPSMMSTAEPAFPPPLSAAPPPVERREPRPEPAPKPEPAPLAPPAAPAAPAGQAPNASEQQRIVTVRVAAAAESRWSGAELMAALENCGLAFGRYSVFHRRLSDGRSLFCAASLVEPGTFNLADMPQEYFRGLSLFAVLPGPADALQTLDAMLDTAADLADAMRGTLQDSRGVALTQQSLEALREDVARFQASLSLPDDRG